MYNKTRTSENSIAVRFLENSILAGFSSGIPSILEEANLFPTRFISRIRGIEDKYWHRKMITKKYFSSILLPKFKKLEFKGDVIRLTFLLDPTIVLALLKQRIERNDDLPNEIERMLGIGFSNKPVKAWPRRYIKWQVAAQIILITEPLHIELEQVKSILIKNKMLFRFLELDALKSIKNAEDWSSNQGDVDISRLRRLEDVIRAVSHRRGKRGRPSKGEFLEMNIMRLPSIYDATINKINANALQIAICTIARILKTQKKIT